MRAGTVAIGTELTTGQIINRNAALIAAELKTRGVPIALHITVPDERDEILRALDYCALRCDLIFVTGGLGPTTDDFTRECVSQWAGLKLRFEPHVWEQIQDRLRSRGQPIHEFQKQQAYFPEGSTILPNALGTANGFRLQTQGKDIIVLPGPPREIESIFSQGLSQWLTKHCSSIDAVLTKSWDTIGYGESHVASLVESAAGKSGFELGYRVHLPYVEVKLSYRRSQESKALPWAAAIEKAIGDITVLRDGQDIVDHLCSLLRGFSALRFEDEVTSGLLFRRLCLKLPLFPEQLVEFSTGAGNSDLPFTFQLYRLEENLVELRILVGAQKRSVRITSPLTSPRLFERRLQYFVEMSLIEAVKILREMV
ncbi:MAG: competence/damage-inducible protein A [Bdellovibrionaceae bacterium]|nr:competence/damage-inducible protein A [Pseudobdellovibrionaceae bacterium]